LSDAPKIVIDVVADKYRFVQTEDGKVATYRNGELWPAGQTFANNMMRAMAERLQEAISIIGELNCHEGAEGWSKDLSARLTRFFEEEKR
jgi:hypothetical protein